MSKTKALLGRYGGSSWPDARAPAPQSAELTPAARKQAQAALEELHRWGVHVDLDAAGRARFRRVGIAPPAARLMIERLGDAIEAHLKENARGG